MRCNYAGAKREEMGSETLQSPEAARHWAVAELAFSKAPRGDHTFSVALGVCSA
jgi:hypothetical protein